jgi:arsenate reductase
MSLKIYHNPRCSKSRQALAILAEKADLKVIDYLKTGLDLATLSDLHKKTGGDVRAMMRTGEAVYKELGLKQIEQDAALLAAMVAHPILLERPLVSDGRCAMICRPPELAAEFLD